MTTLGAMMVFLTKKTISERFNSILIGFASGIMLAASVWSLLLPSIEMSASYGALKFIPALIGILLGGVFLMLLDNIIPKSVLGEFSPHAKFSKLFIAITLHNIPEGLAVGFAFGAAAALKTNAAFLSALGLAIGIGVQNFPEGAAVSLPMSTLGTTKSKAFLTGMLSGAVEPVFAVIGYFLASGLSIIQPWLLSFAAGAMIFVVAEDLIPDSQNNPNKHLGTWGVMLGFALMMVLDVALG